MATCQLLAMCQLVGTANPQLALPTDPRTVQNERWLHAGIAGHSGACLCVPGKYPVAQDCHCVPPWVRGLDKHNNNSRLEHFVSVGAIVRKESPAEFNSNQHICRAWWLGFLAPPTFRPL